MSHVICEHCTSTVIILADRYAKHLLKVHKIKLNPTLYDLEKKINNDRSRIEERRARKKRKNNNIMLNSQTLNNQKLNKFTSTKSDTSAERSSRVSAKKLSLERQINLLVNTRDKRLIESTKYYDKILTEERKSHEKEIQYYEDSKYKKMYEELLAENAKLQTKYTILATEVKSLNQEKKLWENKFSDTAKKLENVQRKLRELGVTGFPKQAATNIQKEEISDRDNNSRNLGGALDGSSGFHNQRENGKFGSLSSFDNYDDDFNDV